MMRWHVQKQMEVVNETVDKMLEEIVAVCRKYGRSLSHQDRQGAFEVVPLDEDYFGWLRAAQISENS